MDLLPRKYSVGQEVWYIPGYRSSYLIAIKCAILDVEEYQVPLYNLDIIVGHSVAEDEVYDSREEAITELISRFEAALEDVSKDMNEADVLRYREALLDESEDYFCYFMDAVTFVAVSHGENKWETFQALSKSIMASERETVNLHDALKARNENSD